ncbi:MAG: hypothetical protein AAGD00_07205 [Planctomycetota bacterium]
MSRIMNKTLIAAAGVACLAGGVSAGMVLPEGFSVTLQNGAGQDWTLPAEDIQEMATDGGTVIVSGMSNPYDGAATIEWSFELTGLSQSIARGPLPPVASVASNIAITNNTGTTQSYIFTVTQGFTVAGPLSATGSISGSVGDSDFSGSGTISDTAGAPGYEALLDGTTFETLLDAPFSTTATGGLTAPFGPDSFLNTPTGGITASIGIRNNFDLTAGDQATANSTLFFVPTPGSVAMLGIAGLAATRRRR